MSANLDSIFREQARRSRAAKAAFGAGACSVPKTSYDPRCYDVEHLQCHFQIAANAVLANVGQTIFTVQIEPMNCPVFDPRAVSASMADAIDPGLPRNMRWTDVSIQDCPQEAIRGKAPTAATTAFWQNFKWDPRERSGCACPVPWGKFTNNANSFPLTLTGFNPHPAGITVTGSVEVYGDCLTSNDFTQCGTRRPMPEIISTNGRTFPAG